MMVVQYDRSAGLQRLASAHDVWATHDASPSLQGSLARLQLYPKAPVRALQDGKQGCHVLGESFAAVCVAHSTIPDTPACLQGAAGGGR